VLNAPLAVRSVAFLFVFRAEAVDARFWSLQVLSHNKRPAMFFIAEKIPKLF